MAMRFFKLLGGNYSQDDQTWTKGEIVPSLTDLAASFGPTHFVEVGKPADFKPETRKTETPSETKFGVDVTEKFPEAPEGVRVYGKGKWYFIVKDGGSKAENSKGLAENDVREFLSDMGEDE
jgi:hypothetical protein